LEISHLDVTAGGGEHVGQVPETGLRQYFGDARVVYGRGAGRLSVAELGERETGGGSLGRRWLEQQLLLLLLRYGERR